MAAACRDDGENTRFPFLATVRYLVAIVVTALAAIVVVMVVIVVHRPVEMGFQSYGYVQTQDYWWSSWTGDNVTYVYEPAKEVQMLIVLEALNPSGRGQIQANITFIHVIDMPGGASSLVQFCGYKLETPASFHLQPHSFHRYRRWVSIKRQGSLQYLYDKHHHDGSLGFPVMVVVETSYKPAHSETIINKTYHCWPLTFLRGEADTPAAGEIACKTTEEIGYGVTWQSLPLLPSSPPPRAQPPF
ncbi:unnamed protein product [Urochloa decumbens]|uniref:Uncharacterized protein n=1 Tax=Urochloa decumbens TaxID=240449 RepID=A0ABC9FK88_9POAL